MEHPLYSLMDRMLAREASDPRSTRGKETRYSCGGTADTVVLETTANKVAWRCNSSREYQSVVCRILRRNGIVDYWGRGLSHFFAKEAAARPAGSNPAFSARTRMVLGKRKSTEPMGGAIQHTEKVCALKLKCTSRASARYSLVV